MPQSLTHKAKAAFLLAVVLILSACGAKVTTAVDIADDGSGTRTITLTMERDPDKESRINGGFDAIDTSIKKHLPPELTYSGLTVSDAQATANLTLSFSSFNDYREKVANLLEYSGVELKPHISIVNSDSPLANGFSYYENFSSTDLIEWIPQSLVTDGVISQENKSSVFATSEPGKITAKGKTYDVESGYLDVKDSADNRFASVFINIDELADGSFETIVYLVRDEKPAGPVIEQEDAYLSSIDIDDVEIDKADSYSSLYERTIKFSSKDSAELAKHFDKVFLTNNTKFDSELDTSTPYSLEITTNYTGSIDTSKIADTRFAYISLSPVGADGFPVSVGDNAPLPDISMTVSRPITIDAFDVAMEVTDDHSSDLTISLNIPAEQAKPFDRLITDKLTPPKELGTLSVTDKGDMRHYTIELSGITIDNSDVLKFLNGTAYATTTEPGKDADYFVAIQMSPKDFLGVQASKVSAIITLPGGDTFVNDRAPGTSDWRINGGQALLDTFAEDINFTAGAVQHSQIGLYIAIALGVLMLIGLILAFVFRKQLKAKLAANREKRQAAAAAATVAQPQPQTPTGPAATPTQPQTPTGPAATPTQPGPKDFDDSDLI
ncbi:hypothetical protein [Arcanobacterium pinnipediorum]|uniref:Uncharacterized protein n=1 Tax=Arcanobacterium pinnipediorum TaxID=1503041 RepID=A0ABY5AIX4_9ACTO|nr:hypothetical protein [Arcanobacterium pinnipediorum]USR79184.1 hypothetical protein NG665_07330 [Arcanobacterium pinnipediorum]